MSDQQPPSSSGSVLKNPQIIAAMIGAFTTLMVAIITILPTVLNNNAPEPTSGVVVTFTPIPTNPPAESASILQPTTQAPVPTPLPSVGPSSTTTVPTLISAGTAAPDTNVLLLYDSVSFTVANLDTRTLSLEGVIFRSSSGQWDARDWGPSVYNSLPAGECLRLRDVTAGQRQPPAPCVNNIYGLIEVGTSAFFWMNVEQFEVVRSGEVIATCVVAESRCEIYIP